MSNPLKSIYLFKDLDPSELEKISKVAVEKSFSGGQDIFLKGSKADALYVIKMGTVIIKATNSSGDEVKIASMATGSHFGELPLLDNEKRSATAQTVESSSLFEFNFESLKKLLLDEPKIGVKVYKALATYLAGRLRVTTEDLSYAKEHNIRHF